MIYICIDHATIYCHSRYSMNHKYEYATDKIYNYYCPLNFRVQQKN